MYVKGLFCLNQVYDDFDYIQIRNYLENVKLLQFWKYVLDIFIFKICRERVFVVIIGNDIDVVMKYLDVGVNIVRVNLMFGNGILLVEYIEIILNQLDDDVVCKRIGWMVSINYIYILNIVYLCKVVYNYY